MDTSMYSKTPTVSVLDNRALTVREFAYYRHPDAPDVTSGRITCHRYDARGFLTQSADPRLHDAGLVNFSYLADLSGSVLRTYGVDNGINMALNDAAGRPFIVVSNIRPADDGTEDRSQAVTCTWQYEDEERPGRPLSVTEQVPGEAARITERFVYAGNTDAEQGLNLAGACISHYDPAGLMQTDSIALTGVPLSVTRRLLKDADNPDVVADWRGEDSFAGNGLPGGKAYTTLTTADATGAMLTTTDAKENQQRVAYDVAGQLSGSWLALKGGAEQVIVKSLTYSAAGQKLREEHGNGVVTTYTYEAQTQRLSGIKTERLAGHAAGAKVLQDLRYEYDPVGNVLKISNDAEETRFWRNQKVVPENTYTYDSLYQLVRATGREMASAGQQGYASPCAIVPLPTDSSAYTNYTRTYSYDGAGNLTQIRHSAPATNNTYTTNITVSNRSNRCVLSTLTENATEVDALFTAGGQQKQLQPGQSLVWTARNELLKVTPVVRDGTADDRESYHYDAGSQRIVKISKQTTGTSTQTHRVLYLPGLELRTKVSGSTESEVLQAIVAGEAGRAQVRVLHWESGKPEGINNDQTRYSYDTLTGSSGLEVDGDGKVINMEEYYPYGGTAVWATRSAVEADYKTVHYSGKERDATGLYYYGYRYYQPWAGRWLSTDPAGTVDGLNLYRMVRNNPVTLRDRDGLYSEADLFNHVAMAVGGGIVLFATSKLYNFWSEKKAAAEKSTLTALSHQQAGDYNLSEKMRSNLEEFYLNSHEGGRNLDNSVFSVSVTPNNRVYAYVYPKSVKEEGDNIIQSGQSVLTKLSKINGASAHVGTIRTIEEKTTNSGGQVGYSPFTEINAGVTHAKKTKRTKSTSISSFDDLSGTRISQSKQRNDISFTVNNPNHFDDEIHDPKDRKIIIRAVNELSNLHPSKAHVLTGQYQGEKLYSYDLNNFGGSSGRGKYRLIYSQDGRNKTRTLHSISDTH